MAAVYLVATVVLTGSVTDWIHSLRPGALPAGYTNVLLLGADELSGGMNRTDTMMVASISTAGDVKLTSIMRDTMVDLPGHGGQKINAAYAFGGAELAKETVNRCFGLNIRNYVLIDFAGFADVIDAIGGIELTVTKEEARQMNKKKGHKLEKWGENVHLDGTQALRFARIRKIDSDFMRAGRQRRMLEAVMHKLRNEKNPATLIRAGQAVLASVKTDMNQIALGATGIKVLLRGGEIEQFRVPAEGTYESGTQDGVWSIRADFERNQALLREFIYG